VITPPGIFAKITQKRPKMCQNHRKWSELRIKSDPKIEKVTENVPQICPKISKSAEKSASNLTLNFGKWQKMRLKSDPKISTLPRAKSPNLSSYTHNENCVVLRNVSGVFYAKMGSKWVEMPGTTNTNPRQKVSSERI